jgi:hypothetical protein
VFSKTTAALLTVAAVQLLSPSVSAQSSAASTNKVITQARAAYYNLGSHNFNGFRATIHPNWKVILGDTATPQNLKVFRSQHFWMSVDARGVVSVNREFDEKPSLSLESSLKQINENLQRLLSGFFETWAFFVISSPFPELEINTEFVDKQYRIFYKALSSEVILRMTADFVITQCDFYDEQTKRTLKPVLQKTSEGLLLRSYHSVIEPGGEGKKTVVSTSVAYVDVGGIKLPNRIQIKGLYGLEPVEAELEFDQYSLTSP